MPRRPHGASTAARSPRIAPSPRWVNSSAQAPEAAQGPPDGPENRANRFYDLPMAPDGNNPCYDEPVMDTFSAEIPDHLAGATWNPAKVTVMENDNAGPRFRRWMPFPGVRV